MKMGVGFLSAGWRTAVQVRPTIRSSPNWREAGWGFFCCYNL